MCEAVRGGGEWVCEAVRGGGEWGCEAVRGEVLLPGFDFQAAHVVYNEQRCHKPDCSLSLSPSLSLAAGLGRCTTATIATSLVTTSTWVLPSTSSEPESTYLPDLPPPS